MPLCEHIGGKIIQLDQRPHNVIDLLFVVRVKVFELSSRIGSKFDIIFTYLSLQLIFRVSAIYQWLAALHLRIVFFRYSMHWGCLLLLVQFLFHT